jgi:hypothetical protein
MIHTQLNYLIAQQRADDLRRAAERERFARSNCADRRAPRWLARLRPAFIATQLAGDLGSMSGAAVR